METEIRLSKKEVEEIIKKHFNGQNIEKIDWDIDVKNHGDQRDGWQTYHLKNCVLKVEK